MPSHAPASRPAVNLPSALLPDRGHLLTEQTRTGPTIDALSVAEGVRMMHQADGEAVAAVGLAHEQIVALIQRIVAAWQAGGRLMYVGAGTSGRLAVLDASECPPTFQSDPGMVIGIIAGGDAALRRSIEQVEDSAQQGAGDLARHAVSAVDVVVGIAAGGTTPYVHGALDHARQRGATVGLVVCVPRAQIAHLVQPADIAICVPTGAEVVAGSTRLKAGTATKLVLNMLTTLSFSQIGKVFDGQMVDLNAGINSKLTDRAARVIARATGVDRSAALELLARAHGQVKPAILMHARGITCEQATNVLASSAGNLRVALARPHAAE